jgi:predicted MFS family arabinose efflux permease
MATRVASSSSPWPAVLSIALGTFVMVTSEFLPVGLLGSIARSLGESEGRTGLLLTIPGLVAAITAPLLSIRAGHVDRRRLLLALTLSIAFANALVAVAPNLPIALVGRFFLGLALGGVWTFAAASGRRLVSEAQGNRAIALILGGISVGTVLGVPIGTLIGGVGGWRSAFLCAAGLSAIIFAAQLVLLPSLPGTTNGRISDLLALAAVPSVRLGFAAAALVAGGHFAAYAYLQPFLAGAGLTRDGVTGVLAGYGLAGVIGTWIGSRLAGWNIRAGFIAVAFTIAGAIALALAADTRPLFAAALIMIWGAAFGALPVCVQIWTYQAAPDRFESGSALTVTMFQTAVAAGAFAGGLAVDHVGLSAAYVLGSICAGLAGLLLLVSRVRIQERAPN